MRQTGSTIVYVASVAAICGAVVVAASTVLYGFNVKSIKLLGALIGLSVVFANLRSILRMAPDQLSTRSRIGVAHMLLLTYAASCSVASGLCIYWNTVGADDVDTFQLSDQLLRELVPEIEKNRALGIYAAQNLYVSVNNLNVPRELAEELEKILPGRKVHSATELSSAQRGARNTARGIAVLEIVGPSFPAWRVAELRFSYGGCSASRNYLYLFGQWIRLGDGWGGRCL